MDNSFVSSQSPHMSEDVREFTKAFLLARVAFPKTGKSGENKNQHYSYSKIEDIYNAVIDPLAANNIAIWHFAYPWDNDRILLETRLTHSLSNQWISDKRFLMCEKPGNQAIGIANTYMRKYAVLSLCGIPTEDDDAEEEEKHIENRVAAPNQSGTLSAEEYQALTDALSLCSNKDWLVERMKEYHKVNDLHHILPGNLHRALDFIVKYGKTKKEYQ